MRKGHAPPRLLNEKKYLCKTLLANIRREKKEMVRRRQRFVDNGVASRELVDARELVSFSVPFFLVSLFLFVPCFSKSWGLD